MPAVRSASGKDGARLACPDISPRSKWATLTTAVSALQQRVVADINAIRTPPGVSVTVTTAQRDPDWYRLNGSDPYGVLSSIQIVGDNIYPYWDRPPLPEKRNGMSVATTIQARAMDLKTALAPKGITGVIVTEEGWPSCFSDSQNPAATINNEIDYFHTWRQHLNQSFDSYYFMTYDLLNETGCPDGANPHFGLCKDTGDTKNSMLCNCRGYCAKPS
jgi:exo-beta-1,3-glucanase (GH17 family)